MKMQYDYFATVDSCVETSLDGQLLVDTEKSSNVQGFLTPIDFMVFPYCYSFCSSNAYVLFSLSKKPKIR